MTGRRGPLLKKMRYYLAMLPPENIQPHKKLNASSRAVLDTRTLREGLAETLEGIQQSLLYSHLLKLKRRGQI
ncbi:hypothetical protein D9Q98_010271 [Chlorella vulgaris]|jgi:hypothetical protein|uniref:Uncharacterized protein n=1 Tax=Chlorella vulgaris TaxID=3077 RepID=A0A9D4YUU1_CHLVU|nr:hypothetical protein D9Q98_010271 [Chlorella vulgaris]